MSADSSIHSQPQKGFLERFGASRAKVAWTLSLATLSFAANIVAVYDWIWGDPASGAQVDEVNKGVGAISAQLLTCMSSLKNNETAIRLALSDLAAPKPDPKGQADLVVVLTERERETRLVLENLQRETPIDLSGIGGCVAAPPRANEELAQGDIAQRPAPPPEDTRAQSTAVSHGNPAFTSATRTTLPGAPSIEIPRPTEASLGDRIPDYLGDGFSVVLPGAPSVTAANIIPPQGISRDGKRTEIEFFDLQNAPNSRDLVIQDSSGRILRAGDRILPSEINSLYIRRITNCSVMETVRFGIYTDGKLAARLPISLTGSLDVAAQAPECASLRARF